MSAGPRLCYTSPSQNKVVCLVKWRRHQSKRDDAPSTYEDKSARLVARLIKVPMGIERGATVVHAAQQSLLHYAAGRLNQWRISLPITQEASCWCVLNESCWCKAFTRSVRSTADDFTRRPAVVPPSNFTNEPSRSSKEGLIWPIVHQYDVYERWMNAGFELFLCEFCLGVKLTFRFLDGTSGPVFLNRNALDLLIQSFVNDAIVNWHFTSQIG